MNLEVNLNTIKQEVRKQILQDGTFEINIGLLFVITGIMRLYPMSFVLLLIFLPLVIFVIEKIKESQIYPRIGKIKLNIKDEISNIGKTSLIMLIQIPIAFIITMITITIFEGDNNDPELFLKWGSYLYGLIMFAISYILIERTNSRYYIIFGIVATCLGFFFSIQIFESAVERLVYYFISLGCFLIIVGIMKFVNLVKSNPIELNEENF